jgi:hypothetical protein
LRKSCKLVKRRRQKNCSLLPFYYLQDSPSEQTAEKLRSEFCQLFATESGYQQLDERKRLTLLKISELLYFLGAALLEIRYPEQE